MINCIMPCNARWATRTHNSVITPDIKTFDTLGLWAWVWQQNRQAKPPTQKGNELLLVKFQAQLLDRESCKP